MITFNSDNIVVGEIKQLLSSFNLPKAHVLKDETSYIGNKIYIKGNNVYRSSFDGSTLEKIEDVFYEWGEPLLNITHTLPITSNIYDSKTHIYLGNYLRWLRDYKGIDLMSMYNCFSNESPINFNYIFSIQKDRGSENIHKFDTSDNGYHLYMIPVKIGKVYTISLNTTRPVEMIAAYYSNNNLIKAFNNSYYLKRSCIQTESFLYTGVEHLDKDGSFISNYYTQEDNLYLFLKLPSSYNSSIVVLEGDFTHSMNVFINNHGYTEVEYVVSTMADDKVTYSYNSTPSRLQLMTCRSSHSYPFADKLLQYLFSGVVCKDDTILNNIKNTQLKLKDKGFLPYIKQFGSWTKDVTAACLLCSHKDLKHREVYKDFDVIGYLDSDIEDELGGIS